MATAPSASKLYRSQNPFIRIVNGLSTVAGWAAAAMIVAAVLITCQMIFIRFVLNGSTIWHTEAVVYLVIAATMTGLSYVQRVRGHVNVDLFPMWVKGGARRGLAIGVLGVSIAVIAVMFWYGFEFWHFAWDRGWRSDTVWGVRLWIPYLSLPIGLGLLLLQLIADLMALILRDDTPFGLEES